MAVQESVPNQRIYLWNMISSSYASVDWEWLQDQLWDVGICVLWTAVALWSFIKE